MLANSTKEEWETVINESRHVQSLTPVLGLTRPSLGSAHPEFTNLSMFPLEGDVRMHLNEVNLC